MTRGGQKVHNPGDQDSDPSLVTHAVVIVGPGGRRTSVRLEPVVWDALRDIAVRQRRTLYDLVTEIDRNRSRASLTASIRAFVVKFYYDVARNASPPPQQPAARRQS